MSLLSIENSREDLLNFLQSLIDVIPGSLYWKDTQGVYLGCNQVVVTTAGLDSKNKIIGKNDEELWPEQAKKIVTNDLRVITSGQTMEFEEKVAVSSEKKMYFLSIKTPLKDSKGKIIGVIGNSLDMTEFKIIKEKAIAANQAKTEFLKAMVVELREFTKRKKGNSFRPLDKLINDIEHFANFDLLGDDTNQETYEKLPSLQSSISKKESTATDNLLKAHKIFGVSKRESECLYYLARGMTMKLVAKTMGLSHRTVEFYIENIKDKLGCHSKSELIAKMFENGVMR